MRTANATEGVESIRLATLRSRAVGMGIFVYRAGDALIDAGFHHARRQLQRWPRLSGARVCLLTHHDEDHVGVAAQLARLGIEVLAPALVAAELKERRRLPLYRRWVWGTAEPVAASPLSGALRSGGWQLVPVHTPGHSPDHFVYHEPDRDLVFAGDLYIGGRVAVAKPTEDLRQLITSLNTVRELQPRALFCAHRGRVVPAVAALEAKIDWLESVIDRAQRLAAAGHVVGAISRELLGREGLMRVVSNGEYCKRNLIEAALRVR